MTDMQTSLPLLIVRTSILNLVMHFSTQPLTSEINCPIRLYLCLAHFIQFPPMLMLHKHQQPSQMIWSTSYRHETFGSSILTSLALHHFLDPSVLSLCSSFPAMQFIASKPPTCPVHQAKPRLNLLHLVTWCQVSYAMSSFITCVPMDSFPKHTLY
jgi:hypothetical protein